MSKRADIEFVNDIREAVQRITSYLGGMSYEAFLADTKTQDAVVRNIEIIGVAAKAISEQLRASSPHIPWKSMAGMRDRLIHHYFGVNLDIVWQVASDELPQLDSDLAQIADEDNPEEPNTSGG